MTLEQLGTILSSTSVDPASSPYLSYTLTTTNFIQFDRFVVHGIANGSGLLKMQLRWSIDNYTTSLGEFTLGSVNYELTSVDISTTRIMPSDSVEFRIYFYSQSGYVFNSNTGPYPSIDEHQVLIPLVVEILVYGEIYLILLLLVQKLHFF
jgi:hypothetical protein